MTTTAPSHDEDSPSFSAKVMVTKPVWVDSQMVMGDDAGIKTGSSHKEKLECPVSTDEHRYELRQRQPFVPLRIL
jgi:hypothetical protein